MLYEKEKETLVSLGCVKGIQIGIPNSKKESIQTWSNRKRLWEERKKKSLETQPTELNLVLRLLAPEKSLFPNVFVFLFSNLL